MFHKIFGNYDNENFYQLVKGFVDQNSLVCSLPRDVLPIIYKNYRLGLMEEFQDRLKHRDNMTMVHIKLRSLKEPMFEWDWSSITVNNTISMTDILPINYNWNWVTHANIINMRDIEREI